MVCKVLGAFALVVATLGGQAFAGQLPGKNTPNVLLIKTNVDKNGHQIQDGAVMYPVTVTLQRKADGSVNFDQLVIDIDAQLPNLQSMPLAAGHVDQTTVPDAVKQIFANADKTGPSTEHINWNIWTPFGSIGNSGFYGYGYYPYWGYDSSYLYNPGYGYYDGGNAYDYLYGYNRSYNNANWYYYYR